MVQFITPYEAARLVGDEMTLAVSGQAGLVRRTVCSRPCTIDMLRKAVRVA